MQDNYFKFPDKDNVHYFHPIAFVRQMKLINGGRRDGFDIEKAVKHLNNNVKPKSIGKCAKFVRLSLVAGGINTTGNPIAAKDYDVFLPKLKFIELKISSLEDYDPIKGDLAVIEAFQGKNKYHKWGHLQMYNGKKWVSDFVQRGFWAGSDYRTYKPNFKIFRW